MKPKATDEYVQMDDMPWAPFPTVFSKGGINWRLLNVSPEAGTWTAVFECPAGSSFNHHSHTGPGHYFLYKGKMEVRGGIQEGGDTAIAPGYGFEASGAEHEQTYFPIDSMFYMSFSGPLAFLRKNGEVIANVGWDAAQAAWEGHLVSQKRAAA